jgi:hypothetical protein
LDWIVAHTTVPRARRAPSTVPAPPADQTASRVRYAAAAASAYAALVHNWVLPAHVAEWWGYGVAFFVMAAGQGFYSGLLLLWPRRSVFIAGIAWNAAILALYAVTRTLGVPFVGPQVGQVEAVAPPDLAAAVAEVVLVIALVQLLRTLPAGASAPQPAPPLAHEEKEE